MYSFDTYGYDKRLQWQLVSLKKLSMVDLGQFLLWLLWLHLDRTMALFWLMEDNHTLQLDVVIYRMWAHYWVEENCGKNIIK